MPLPIALCLSRPLCAEVKGLPSAQKQPRWTGTGQTSGTFLKKKKKKKISSSFPGQRQPEHLAQEQSSLHEVSAPPKPHQYSNLTMLTTETRCAFPAGSISGTKESPGLLPMPFPLQIQWGKDIKLKSRYGVPIFLRLESFPTNREGAREGGRGGGRQGLREGLESLPRERENKRGGRRKQDSIQFLLTLCPSLFPCPFFPISHREVPRMPLKQVQLPPQSTWLTPQEVRIILTLSNLFPA